MTISDYVNHAVKGLEENFSNSLDNRIMQYKNAKIFRFDTTREYKEIFTSTEGMAQGKVLSELENPPLRTEGEGYNMTITESRFGNAIQVTSTQMRQAESNTEMIDKYLAQQAADNIISSEKLFLNNIFQMLNLGFTTELTIDGLSIFNATHTWKSTGNSFDNYATKAMSVEALEDLDTYGGAFQNAQEDGAMPVDFDTVIVKKGSAASRTARKILAEKITPTAIGDVNIFQGEKTIVETPYITNPLHWFARDSKLPNPLYVGVGHAPRLKPPIRMQNESQVINVEGFWKRACVNMPWSWYGSDGTT